MDATCKKWELRLPFLVLANQKTKKASMLLTFFETLRVNLEREKSLELSTSTLARLRSTN
jgi:hypothetical protein